MSAPPSLFQGFRDAAERYPSRPAFPTKSRSLAALDVGKGVPYMMHQLRVKVRLD